MSADAPLLANLPYGCPGCTCGTHATPDAACSVHRAQWLAERASDAVISHARSDEIEYDVDRVKPENFPQHYDAIRAAFVGILPQAFELTDLEVEASEALHRVMHIITREWKLKKSDNLPTELCLHIHGLQGFIVQHMLQRMGVWGEWYEHIPGREEQEKILGDQPD